MTSYNARTAQRRRARNMGFELSADSLLDMAKRRPEAVLLIGAGIALMLRSASSFSLPTLSSSASRFSNSYGSKRLRDRDDRQHGGGYQPTGEDGSVWSEAADGAMSSARGAVRTAAQSVREAADDAGKFAQETSEGMTRYASQMMNRAAETASTYASSASRLAADAREGVLDRSHRIAERARTLPEEIDEAVQDHPLVLAALGVAVGAALGASLPATSIENRALGKASDDIWDAAEGVTGRIGDAAEQAYYDARRAAKERGLSTDGLKDVASEVGSKFANAVIGEADAKPTLGSDDKSSSQSGGASTSSAAKPGATSGNRTNK